MIIGLSGGVDSCLVALLARVVCDRLGEFKLIGRFLGIESTEEELTRSRMMGELFCDQFSICDMTLGYHQLLENVWPDYSVNYHPDFEERISKGNIKARLRMIYLFDLARRQKGIVLSTDNYTEWLLGFWTLHGDVGNFGPIQNLWKKEVYELTEHIKGQYEKINAGSEVEAIQACIDAVPTDGLGITSSDTEQFGVDSYSEVDSRLYAYTHGEDFDTSDPVITMHFRTHFKREDPYNISRAQLRRP